MKPDTFEEQVFFTTTRISYQSENLTESSIGTGFIVQAKLKDRDNMSVILLVSNKHVFRDSSGNISFSLNKAKVDGSVDLGNIDTYKIKDFSNRYFEHPDPKIDLACINISVISTPPNNSYFRQINEELISKFDEPNLKPGMEVWFVGYPENRFDSINNLPLLRRGYISSLPKVNYNNNEQFIIDAQVYQGSSGSALFTVIDGHYKLIGIVTATMIKHGKLQTINTAQTNLGVVQTLGLGIVIKSTKLIELIDKVLIETSKQNSIF